MLLLLSIIRVVGFSTNKQQDTLFVCLAIVMVAQKDRRKYLYAGILYRAVKLGSISQRRRRRFFWLVQYGSVTGNF